MVNFGRVHVYNHVRYNTLSMCTVQVQYLSIVQYNTLVLYWPTKVFLRKVKVNRHFIDRTENLNTLIKTTI